MSTAYELQMKVGAQLASSFNSTFSSAQKRLSETQKEIQSLSKVQSNISAYQKQEAAMAKCLKQQDLYKAQITNLKKELAALTKENGQHGAGTSALANKILDLEKKMSSVAAEEDRHREALRSLGNELKEAGIDTKQLGDEIEKIGKKIGGLKSEQDELGKKLEEGGEKGGNAFAQIGEALAAAGILKTLEATYKLMVDITEGAAAYADEIGTVSVQYGIAAEDLQAFTYAAELVDVSQETLTSTMSRNIRAMNSARDGTESYVEAYEKLGVKVTYADGQLRDAETVYWEVIDALGAMENETERDAVAIELLGRSAQQLNTLVAAGSGVIKEYAAEAKRAGYVMSDETLAACMALDDEIQRQNSNMTALKNTIGGQLAPAYTALKQAENEALIALTGFVDEHPELVKGVTAAAGAFGILTGAVAAYSVAAKAASAATKLIPGIGTVLLATGAIAVLVGGIAAATANAKDKSEELTAVSEKQRKELEALEAEYRDICDQYGVTSYQAQELSWQLEELSREYEASKQTIAEYNAEFSAVMEEYRAMAQEHEELTEKVNQECDSLISLVNRLNELSEQTNITAGEKEEILAIIERLNSEIPGLALSYDQLTHSMSLTSDEIMRLAEIEISKRKYENDQEQLIQKIEKRAELEKAYTDAEAQVKAAYEKYRDFENEILYPTEGKDYYLETEYAYNELDRLEKEYNQLADSAKAAKKAFDDNEIAINNLSTGMASLTGTTTGLEKIASDIIAHGENMKTIYDEVYASAYESITGQFALWENAAEVVPKSIEDINNALATQGAYWSDYNKDMSVLLERGQDIEGLAEVIASFADGSEESVNVIAGMVSASDEDLRLMIENYNLMKEQQANAAKTLAASSSEELLEIEDQMNSTIQNLDLKEEAALAGKSTIEAYVKALREGSEEAAEYLNALAGILGDKMSYNSAGTAFDYNRGELYSKYATGTLSARSGLSLLGERGPELVDFSGGEVVYNAQKTERVLSSMLDTHSLLASVPIAPIQSSGNRYDISISPTFYVTNEDSTHEKLEEYSDIVANMVLEKLSAIEKDTKRGAFV